MSLLLIFLVLCAQVSEFTRVCIGRNRETLCLFDLLPHELVPDADSIRPAKFEKKRPILACVNAVILGEVAGNIGRYAESRYKIFEEADWTIVLGLPPEFTTTGFGAFWCHS